MRLRLRNLESAQPGQERRRHPTIAGLFLCLSTPRGAAPKIKHAQFELPLMTPAPRPRPFKKRVLAVLADNKGYVQGLAQRFLQNYRFYC